MNAIVCPSYGPPEVLERRRVTKPIPKDNEVLIRTHAALVTTAGTAFRKGKPFLARVYAGLRRPRHPILGSELAGEIEAVGKDVTRFSIGDTVLAASDSSFGAHAEYKCLPEDGMLAAKPETLDYPEAAGLLEATTALTFLRDIAPVQPGQRVLINGASGSVGYFAVQLAKHFGAHVTAVCSSANVSLVESLGADAVVDYTKEDFTASGQRYDVILDAVGKSSFSRCRDSLTEKGIYLSTVPGAAIMAQTLWTSRSRGKRAKFAATGLMQKTTNLAVLTDLFESGKLRAVIDRRYRLADIADAYRYVEAGHKRGTVALTV